MDNFSQETDEKDFENQTQDSQNISDIQFEEAAEETERAEETALEKIDETSEGPQEATEAPAEELSEEIADEVTFEETETTEATPEETFEEGELTDEELTKELQDQFMSFAPEEAAKEIPKEIKEIGVSEASDKNAKKYVIYIDEENIDFIESLSIQERKDIINKILNEQDIESKKRNAAKAKMRYLKHAIITCLTFIVCFPILFFLVNKSLEISITNYQRSRENFVKLYKEQGKIKRSEKNLIGK